MEDYTLDDFLFIEEADPVVEAFNNILHHTFKVYLDYSTTNLVVLKCDICSVDVNLYKQDNVIKLMCFYESIDLINVDVYEFIKNTKLQCSNIAIDNILV